MKCGDILLVRNKWCPLSIIIRTLCRSKYNHVVWAISDNELIEMSACGKKISPLKGYLNSFLYDIKLLRIKKPHPLLKYVIWRSQEIEEKYSYWSFIHVCICYLLGRELPRLTCSGFVGYYLSLIGWYPGKKCNPKYLLPKDFAISNKLKDVSNEI